jgi:hypothetical protein
VIFNAQALIINKKFNKTKWMIILVESDGTCQNFMSKFKGDLPPKILPEITILASISRGLETNIDMIIQLEI